MSVQLVAPHSVASKAMNSTSLRSCNALSARGSGRSAKQVAKLFIDGSFLDRNHLLNPFCQLEQQLTHPNMRFPCPSYGGGAPSYGAEGEGHRRFSKISDLKLAGISTEAFPLRPCG